MGVGLTIVVVAAVSLLSWAGFWGALSANVGMSRGVAPGRGLLWGALLGPIGLAVVMMRSRGGGKGLEVRKAAALSNATKYGEKARRSAVASAAAWRGPSGPTSSPSTWNPGSQPMPTPGSMPPTEIGQGQPAEGTGWAPPPSY